MLKGVWFVFGALIVGALLVLSAKRATEQAPYAKRAIKSYRVLILPICNPGFRCDPKLPRQLEHLFFRHEHGVAAFIKNLSRGQAHIIGHATDWMRPAQKLKSTQQILDRREELLALSYTAKPDTYDMVFLYTMTSGPATEQSFTQGQWATADLEGLEPGLALMINAPIFHKAMPHVTKSAILPSTSWAHKLLHVMGLTEKPWNLSCPQKDHVASCTMEQSAEEDVMIPPGYLRRAMKWANTSIRTISQNGIYRLDSGSRNLPSALEIRLPKPIRFNAIRFDRLFVEPKSYGSSFLKLFPSQDNKNSHGLNSIFNHAFIYLSTSDDESTISLLNPLSEDSTHSLLTKKSTLEILDTSVTMTIVKHDSTSLAIKIDGL